MKYFKTQDPKYDICIDGDRAYLVNTSTKLRIPENEPIMIFRAKDKKALCAITEYKGLCRDPDHIKSIERRALEFFEYAMTNETKEPDTDLSIFDKQA